MNKIDIIIPTMWSDKNFIARLEKYCNYSTVNKIILIDNQKSKRPTNSILNHPKIELVCYNKNIYVNPAWNEGYYRSEGDILAILNDDIFVDERLFEFIQSLDMSEIDIIGSYLRGTISNYSIQENFYEKEELLKVNVNKSIPIGSQCYAFGVCMFIKKSSYKVIPSLYKIWFGDDYLIQNSESVYALKTNYITGDISKTLTDSENKNDFDKRIHLDTHNAYQYNHFKDGKNWDIIKNTINSKNNKKTAYVENIKSIPENLRDIPTGWTHRIHSGWTHHIHFSQWLVNKLNPDIIVDLGVDYGYSTFCFASPKIGKVYGIDCFSGDSQSGFKNTYDYVNHKKEELGLDNIKFVKGYFGIIAKKWNKPIDILHIDGFHSYDAVKNNYNTWSKFVKDDGVILLHGTCVTKPGYEVYKFFNEIDLPKTNFTFSYGLGVISKNTQIIEEINCTFDLENPNINK